MTVERACRDPSMYVNYVTPRNIDFYLYLPSFLELKIFIIRVNFRKNRLISEDKAEQNK